MALSSTSNITHTSGKSLVAINGTQLPLKFSAQNYSTWHAQITPLLQGHNLMGYVTGTIICPPTHVEKNGTHISNPDYEFWECQDQLILAAIIASVSFSFMNTIADSKTSAEAWNKLQLLNIFSLSNPLRKNSSCVAVPYMMLISSFMSWVELA
ncbi:hypothetical protein GH714_012560 [Hevea brasiliensis]|uniref:Retrotransposon Copia-like N-terminal domain-containing protein n=1 Tax=Hevea brasiliensis TaxID=3981 RepID=A0A6A6MMR6_HEVBR|nr:hypothetical protein GH714_012560 [Hevea brasiliensis]